MKNYDFLLYTRCHTFNHAPYIMDTMNGFCMQQTTFPFVCVIVDDASTDGEPEVIEKYLQEHFNLDDGAVARREETDDYRLTFAQHKTNKNCYFVVLLLKYNHYHKKDKQPYYAEWIKASKYAALCEGDDYWTDPLKLQKQVDFLESHQEYDMVCARFKHLIHETGEIIQSDLYDHVMPAGVDGMELKQEHFVHFAQPHPCTVLYRNGTLYDHPIYPKLKYKFDIPLYYIFLYNHKIWLMADKMAVYRLHQGSLTAGGTGVRWNTVIVQSYKELLSYFPNDTNLQRLVGSDIRKDIIRKSGNKSFSFEEFAQLLKNYLKYHPSYRNIISLLVRVIQQRLRLLKNPKSL